MYETRIGDTHIFGVQYGIITGTVLYIIPSWRWCGVTRVREEASCQHHHSFSRDVWSLTRNISASHLCATLNKLLSYIPFVYVYVIQFLWNSLLELHFQSEAQFSIRNFELNFQSGILNLIFYQEFWTQFSIRNFELNFLSGILNSIFDQEFWTQFSIRNFFELIFRSCLCQFSVCRS